MKTTLYTLLLALIALPAIAGQPVSVPGTSNVTGFSRLSTSGGNVWYINTPNGNLDSGQDGATGPAGYSVTPSADGGPAVVVVPAGSPLLGEDFSVVYLDGSGFWVAAVTGVAPPPPPQVPGGANLYGQPFADALASLNSVVFFPGSPDRIFLLMGCIFVCLWMIYRRAVKTIRG